MPYFHYTTSWYWELKAGNPAISPIRDPWLSDTASRRLWLYQLSGTGMISSCYPAPPRKSGTRCVSLEALEEQLKNFNLSCQLF
jgi:hypothetical protein